MKTPKPIASQPKLDEQTERSAIETLRAIKAGDVDSKLLNPQTRRACVTHLIFEGLTSSEIAHLLKCSERTIERDRNEIREANSLRVDDRFPARIAGELFSEAELAIGRIRRAARDAAAAPGERITAEKLCFDIRCDLVDRLQSLGYLPSATRRTELSFGQSGAGGSGGIAELTMQFNQAVTVLKDLPELATDPAIAPLLADMERSRALAATALTADQLASACSLPTQIPVSDPAPAGHSAPDSSTNSTPEANS